MNTSFVAHLRRFGRALAARDPLQTVILGYVSYILTGWALLCLWLAEQFALIGQRRRRRARPPGGSAAR